MKVNIYKASVLLLLTTILVAYTNCGSPFGQTTPLFFTSNVYGGSASISYQAFSTTVYPITCARCVSCHATQQPAHASPDVAKAHDAIISNFKVNFLNIPTSRMVKKLRDDNHNCWSDCEANALEMEAAIGEWNEVIKKSGAPQAPAEIDTKIYTSQSKFLAEEFATVDNFFKKDYVNLSAEPAMVNPPMVKASSAMEGTYLWVPNSVEKVLAGGDPTAGKASLNFAIRQASNQYKVWGLVNAPNVNDNAFIVKMTSVTDTFHEWEIPVTDGWEWRQLPNTNFNLTVGNHTLEISERKNGTKIKQVVITADNNFNAANYKELTGVTLTYDLSEALRVPGITFKIDVIDYDLYSYRFQNPRIVTATESVKVKTLRLLVNKTYNPQHSTYNLVNKVATAADGKLSDYAMLVIKDKGLALDKISFSFEELKLATDGTSTGGTAEDMLMASQEAYKTSVWAVSRTSCIGCHTVQNPPHAHPDYKEAHDVVLTQNLVNFTTPASSRLITKVRGGHNCGNATQCDAIANQFQAAIVEWKKSRP